MKKRKSWLTLTLLPLLLLSGCSIEDITGNPVISALLVIVIVIFVMKSKKK